MALIYQVGYGSGTVDQSTGGGSRLDGAAAQAAVVGVQPVGPSVIRGVPFPGGALWGEAGAVPGVLPTQTTVLLSDLKLYAAAVTPESDADTAIGGAIDTTKKFLAAGADFTGAYQVVSSAGADTTQTLTLTYRDPFGAVQTEVKTLGGTTPVTSATVIERVLKVAKSASTAGDVALESQTAVRTGTIPVQPAGLSIDEVALETAASAADGFYNGNVLRVTGDVNNFEIFEVVNYVGATRVATLNRQPSPFSLVAGLSYRIAAGVYLDKKPSEILTVVRMDETAVAPQAGAANKTIYVKGFFRHTNANASGLSITTVVVKKFADPTGAVTFAIGTALNDAVTNGVGNNRTVAPLAGVTAFDGNDKNAPGTQVMAPLDAIAVWQALLLTNGRAAIKSSWTPAIAFVTV